MVARAPSNKSREPITWARKYFTEASVSWF